MKRLIQNPYAFPPILFCLAILGAEFILDVCVASSPFLSTVSLSVSFLVLEPEFHANLFHLCVVSVPITHPSILGLRPYRWSLRSTLRIPLVSFSAAFYYRLRHP